MRTIRVTFAATAFLGFLGLSLFAQALDFVPGGLAPEGDGPSDVAFTPDGLRIVVANRESKNLVVFDAATRDVLQVIPISGSPEAVEVSSDGIHAVVANVLQATVSIVRLDTAQQVATVPVGLRPSVVRITPDGTKAAVSNTGSNDLSIIDIGNATELLRIPGASQQASVNMNWETGSITSVINDFELAGNTKLVYPDVSGNKVKIFDITNGSFVALGTPEMTTPKTVAVTPDGTRAVVTHGSANRISVIDIPGQSVIKVIPLGFDPGRPIAVNFSGTKAIVGSNCRLVDLVSETISPSLCTGGVEEILTTADGAYALGVGPSGNLISYASASVVLNVNGVVDATRGAISPTGSRAAMVGGSWDEDLAVMNTAGAAGFLEEVVPTGPPAEGDRARSVAISPDGTKAILLGYISRTASIVDLPSRTVTAVVGVGVKPTEAEFTPDGALVVVANLDSAFASIIDMRSHAVTSVPISSGGNQVEISPDGQFAYVSVIDADGVWRIDLGTLAVSGPKLATGNMDIDPLGTFQQRAGMTLSHDGGTLVTCNGVSHNVTIIDTASWTVVATKSLGGIPTRAVFSADDGTIYVSESDNGKVFRITNAGAASAVTGSVTVGSDPRDMVISAGKLYVGSWAASNSVGVVNLSGAMSFIGTLPGPLRPVGLWIDEVKGRLFVNGGMMSVTGSAVLMSGEFRIFDLASNALLASIDTKFYPGQPDAFGAPSLFAIPSPLGDGMHVIELGSSGDVENSLTVGKSNAGKLRLFWDASCAPGDSDYAIYVGVLGSYYSHHSAVCSTGGHTFALVTPPVAGAYYLIVPRTVLGEGSYGRDSAGNERPPGTAVCVEQDFGGCP